MAGEVALDLVGEAAGVDRLLHEAIGADGQAGLLVALGGDRDDRRALQLGDAAQAQRHLVAVQVGHVDVDQHEVRLLGFGQSHALEASLGVQYLVAGSVEQLPHQQAVGGIVFDVEDFGHGRKLASPRQGVEEETGRRCPPTPGFGPDPRGLAPGGRCRYLDTRPPYWGQRIGIHVED